MGAVKERQLSFSSVMREGVCSVSSGAGGLDNLVLLLSSSEKYIRNRLHLV